MSVDAAVDLCAVAKQTWESTVSPTSRSVRAAMISAGYKNVPSFKTISIWAKKGQWKKPPGKKKSKMERKLDSVAPVLTGDPRTKAEDIVNAVMKALPPPDEPKQDEPKAEGAKDEDKNPDPEAQAREDAEEARRRLKAVRDAISGDPSDEHLLSTAARQSLKTSIVMDAVLAELAPQLIAVDPEAACKAHLACAESLEKAASPFDRIGAARERAMKTIGADGAINGEVMPPGSSDPLADAIAAFKRDAA